MLTNGLFAYIILPGRLFLFSVEDQEATDKVDFQRAQITLC